MTKKADSLATVDEILAGAAEEATRRIRSAGSNRLEYVSGTVNEERLFEVIQSVCVSSGFGSEAVLHVGGHRFPDIIFPDARVGVEIKCHRRAGEDLLGNSIMGSTFSIPDPVAIRLLIWTDSTREVRVFDYFDSVVGSEVTHSPRFKLRPGASPTERLFGTAAHQIGSVEEVCLSSEGIQSEVILAKMRARALEQGDVPWWLGDSGSMASGDSAAIVRAHRLSVDKRNEIESIGTFVFPEVLGSGSKKYERVIGWAIATRGVLLSRDNFSASGQLVMALPEVCLEHEFRLPRAFGISIERLARKVEVSVSELRQYWDEPCLTIHNAIEYFAERLARVTFSEVERSVRESMCISCEHTSQDLRDRLIRSILNRVELVVIDA